MAKRIDVNNSNFIEIESKGGGVSVASCDKMGYVERRDYFDDGEIVMALNLLRYMRDQGMKTVYLIHTPDEQTGTRDMEDFRIFQ